MTMTTDHSAAAATSRSNENIDTGNNKNIMVADSDLQGALRGIENCLGELKDEAAKAAKDTDMNRAGDPEANNDAKRNEKYSAVLHSMLSEAEQSLPEHVRRITQPVSDEEYFAHTRGNENSNDDEEMDNDEASRTSEEDNSVDLQDEYDEAELMDQEALKRAKELRSQVREAAKRVQALRNSVTESTVSITKGEVELLMGPRQTVDKEFDQERFESQFRQVEAAHTTSKSAKLLEMEQSLAALMSSLDGMDLTLPESIENLQETVQTIEESLARHRGGEENLSQTERAIISRENEGASQNVFVEENTSTESVAPEKRLGDFLGRH